MAIKYPVDLKFEFHTLNPEAKVKVSILLPMVSVKDADGKLLYFVKQKLFELKEKVTIFADQEQTKVLNYILADRIIDFSANYKIVDTTEKLIGTVRRKGMRSLWKAAYEICHEDLTEPAYILREKSFFIRFIDSLISVIPLIGGMIFNPTYLIRDQAEVTVMTLKKRPSWFEGKFRIEKLEAITQQDEELLLLSLMMITLLERVRG